ncbi:MAG: hypothetical protein HOV77_30165 [Hamadaea sp.]|uniref:cell division protein PerM n=1 Tax=Hamadaea sp. TaxID=2024425 RepID=UPI0017FE3A2A|nr:DUF6350 family protein [Hamadaea sp.]NUT23457.1 hypothetical protein [Hamadaea sp.]
MAGTPDEETLAAAEAKHLSLRETVAFDLHEPAGPTDTDEPRVPRQSARGSAPAMATSRRVRPLPWPRALGATVVNALLAALTAVLPVTLLTAGALLAADQPVNTATSVRVGLAGWLLSLGVPLRTDLGTLTLAPLALGVLAWWRLFRAGVHTTRALGARGSRDLRRVGQIGLLLGVAYAVLAGLSGWFVDAGAIGVAPLRAALHGLVVGAIFAGLGALRATGAIAVVARRVPKVLRDATRTGGVAALLVIGAGAGVTGVAVALHGGDANAILAGYKTDVAGQAGVTLVSLAIAPNMAVWAAAYLLGPGFAFGPAGVVRASFVGLDDVRLPALPVFAAMPESALGGLANAVLGLPLLAGITAGWLLTRRRLRPRDGVIPEVRWGHLLTGSILAGPVAGLALGLAAIAASGRLTTAVGQVGPAPLSVALVGAGVTALGCLLGALGTRPIYEARRRSTPE